MVYGVVRTYRTKENEKENETLCQCGQCTDKKEIERLKKEIKILKETINILRKTIETLTNM
jgi:predicted  nucleic acid-binding Zn-ribbon protein